MSENKTKNNKNLKNKKELTKALAKTTKSKAGTKKKTTTTKKVPAAKPKIVKEEEVAKLVESATKAKKSTRKPKKEIEPIITKPVAKKIEKKPVKKTEKKPTKKEIKKKEEKIKELLPKEWAGIKEKVQNKDKEKTTEPEEDLNITTRLKKSIFEEVDEKTYKIQRAKEKESLKKSIITLLIIAAVIALAILILYLYNDSVRKSLTVYDEYSMGDAVTLKDNSTWHVVENSGKHDPTVKLLSDNIADLNNDGLFDGNDILIYSPSSKSEYNPLEENSIGFYVNNTYKKKIEESVGKVESVGILSSKEFVKLRNKLGLGNEWSEPNWLGNDKLVLWWVESSPKEDSVYVVTHRGTYMITKANTKHALRPTIVISKDKIKTEDEEVEEPTEENTEEVEKTE
jgi:hypothetical protein